MPAIQRKIFYHPIVPQDRVDAAYEKLKKIGEDVKHSLSLHAEAEEPRIKTYQHD